MGKQARTCGLQSVPAQPTAPPSHAHLLPSPAQVRQSLKPLRGVCTINLSGSRGLKSSRLFPSEVIHSSIPVHRERPRHPFALKGKRRTPDICALHSIICLIFKVKRGLGVGGTVLQARPTRASSTSHLVTFGMNTKETTTFDDMRPDPFSSYSLHVCWLQWFRELLNPHATTWDSIPKPVSPQHSREKHWNQALPAATKGRVLKSPLTQQLEVSPEQGCLQERGTLCGQAPHWSLPGPPNPA